METLNYQDRFHEALQRAFAASNPGVRAAYFELALFYRNRLGGALRTPESVKEGRRISDGLDAEAPKRPQ